MVARVGLFLSCFSLLLAAGCGSPTSAEKVAEMGAPKVGETAPALALSTLDGTKVDIAELEKSGPVVFVQLRGWVTYQCPLCTKQVGDLVSHAEDFKAAGAQVVLAYPGPAEGLDVHAKEFIADAGLPEGFHFVLDPDLTVVKAWGLHWDAPKETAYPATIVVDTANTVRYANISDSHGGRAAASDVVDVVKSLKK